MTDRLIVRSYRRVFRIDRRIYRVDRWALPVPGGVPLRGVAYFAVALLGVLVLGRVPVAGAVLGELSAPLRLVILPLAVAVLATQAAPDGRMAHRFAIEWLRLCLRPRRRSAGRPVALEGEALHCGGTLAITADCESAGLSRGRVRGPARAEFSVPVTVMARRGGLVAVANDAAGPRRVDVADGQVLEVGR